MDYTNAQRGADVETALMVYAMGRGLIRAGESLNTALGDLLCDAQHLARRAGLDFDRLLEGAREAYAEELRHDEEGPMFVPDRLWPSLND